MKDLGFETHDDIVRALLERGADPLLLWLATRGLERLDWKAVTREPIPWREEAKRAARGRWVIRWLWWLPFPAVWLPWGIRRGWLR